MAMSSQGLWWIGRSSPTNTGTFISRLTSVSKGRAVQHIMLWSMTSTASVLTKFNSWHIHHAFCSVAQPSRLACIQQLATRTCFATGPDSTWSQCTIVTSPQVKKGQHTVLLSILIGVAKSEMISRTLCFSSKRFKVPAWRSVPPDSLIIRSEGVLPSRGFTETSCQPISIEPCHNISTNCQCDEC